MGLSLCKDTGKQSGASWVGNETENPFTTQLTKKDRTCLRETFQRLQDPRSIVGLIFVDIVHDLEPDLRVLTSFSVFGVHRAPKSAMMTMPKFGSHITRFTELLDQVTTMLGVTENLTGAWQFVRKTGRAHVKQGFLEQRQNQLEKNYFELVLVYFASRFIPYLTGELAYTIAYEPLHNQIGGKTKSESDLSAVPDEPPNDKDTTGQRKVRFAQSYAPDIVASVWRKLFNVIASQMTDAFELERHKVRANMNQKTLAPHQHAEFEQRRKEKIKERQSEIEGAANAADEKKPEQLFEDPF